MSRKRSKFDEFFERSEENAVCKKCKKPVAWTKTSGTNAASYHLTKHHPELYEKMVNEENEEKKRRENVKEETKRQSTIPFPVEQTVSCRRVLNTSSDLFQNDSTRLNKLDKAVIKMLCNDILPFSLVENKGFKNFVETLAPGTRLKSRSFYSSKGLNVLTEEIEEKVKKDLKSAEEISLTTDGWDSKNEKHSLLSVTAHWINNKTFEPCYSVLGSFMVSGRHTALNFSELIDKNLENFDIPRNNIVSITRDGASTMDAMCSKLEIHCVHCYAHFLQLCVKDLLKEQEEIEAIVEKMKKMARKLHRSGIAQEAFKKILNGEGLPERMLKKSTEVRWSSLLMMIRSFLENKKAVMLLPVDHHDLGFPIFQPNEWEILELLEKVLSPVAETTKSAQHRYLAPASTIIPSICLLISELEEFENSETENLSTFAKRLKNSINERSGKYLLDDNLRTCTFLDPRFKDLFFKTSHKDFVIRDLLKNDKSTENCEDSNDVAPASNSLSALYSKILGKLQSPHLRVQLSKKKLNGIYALRLQEHRIPTHFGMLPQIFPISKKWRVVTYRFQQHQQNLSECSVCQE